MDFTASSTGFINYFPSAERTAKQIENAYKQHGDDIIIVDGDDDWYADPIFHVSSLLKEIGIPVIGRFHIGISGVSDSGAIIAKNDLKKLLDFINREVDYWDIPAGAAIRSRLAWYDKEHSRWNTIIAKAV